MKLTKLLLIAPFALATSFASAQTYVDNSGKLNLYSRKAESEKAQGSQYFIEKFNPAKIGESTDISLVRYNAYTDELEVKVNEEIQILQPVEKQIIQLRGDVVSYEYVTYTNKEGITVQNYMILVSDSPNFKIYKKERITLIPEQHPAGGYQKYKAPQYKKLDPDYYVQIKDGQIVPMSTKKSDIVELVPSKETEVKDFIKSNKISTSEDADLKKLGAYMSTLL